MRLCVRDGNIYGLISGTKSWNDTKVGRRLNQMMGWGETAGKEIYNGGKEAVNFVGGLF